MTLFVDRCPSSLKDLLKMSAEHSRLSALDTMYLDAETDATPMHIACLFTMKADHFLDSRDRVRSRAIREHIDASWHGVTAAHLRLSGGDRAVAPYCWEYDKELDLAAHVQITRLKPRATDRDLLNRCADILRSPLPRDIPMWRLHILSGLSRGRLGFLLQIHHSLSDPQGAAEMLRALMDTDEREAHDMEYSRGGERCTAAGATSPLEGRPSVSDTVRTLAENVVHIAEGAAYLAASAKVRPSTSLNAPVTAARHLDTATFPVAEAATLAHRLSVTVDDVVLSAVAGAIGSILGLRGDPIATMVLEALVPVSMRRCAEIAGFGNQASVMQVPLPIGITDPLERTRVIHDATTKRQDHHSVEAVFSAERLANSLHVPFQAGLNRLMFDHQKLVNLVVTNIPGPDTPMWFMGTPVATMAPFVPLGRDLPLAVAFATYNNTCTIGVQSDPNVCADAHNFGRAFIQEIHSMTARLADSSVR